MSTLTEHLARAKRANKIGAKLVAIKQADPEGYTELCSDYDVEPEVIRAAYAFADMGFSAESFET